MIESGTKIIIKGAAQHNLKRIDLSLPRNRIIVITGISGSGKSTLAFDTIYAEGQRRYVESLSSYARQFLEKMDKPEVEYIEGLSPAIAIEQRKIARNPRSTVGTITEIYDYMRLLFARVGDVFCPRCNVQVKASSADEITTRIMELPEGTRINILAPKIRGRKGEHREVINNIIKSGYVRLRINSKIYDVSDVGNVKLDRYKKHTIEVLVDRLIIKKQVRSRLFDSVEIALKEGEGLITVKDLTRNREFTISEKFMCPKCGWTLSEISPRMFSFNSPYGACEHCHGLGTIFEIDPDLVIRDRNLPLADGELIRVSGFGSEGFFLSILKNLAKKYKFSLYTPFSKLPKSIQNLILYGSRGEKINFKYSSEDYDFTFKKEFEGIIPMVQRRYNNTTSMDMKYYYQSFMSIKECPVCHGDRLKPAMLSIRIKGRNIIELIRESVKDLVEFMMSLKLDRMKTKIAHQVISEIKNRLKFLLEVGLGYLTLDRKSETLAGGEAGRIKLATQIGSQLVGVLYILDEPTIGLHYRDNKRLIETLNRLRDMGNTLILVEHDEMTIRNADYIVDLGPGAGNAGGEVVAAGTLKQIISNKNSLTGKYLNGVLSIPVPDSRKKPTGKWLEIIGAVENNLKSITVKIPLKLFVCITGVSGAGKSTLLNDVLYRALMRHFYNSRERVGNHKGIKGLEYIDNVIYVSQSPIGRTSRSNPATYTKVFDPIRHIFAQLKESRIRGYKRGRFSFNVKGGRCEHCQGQGIIKIEMQFLPDVYVKCDVCNGHRFNRETLEIKFKGKNIAEILELSVDEAYELFVNIPKINKGLRLLKDVGLGYLKLGQPAPTLSGGEAQRIKLSRELSKRETGNTIYILDEPTTGLHFADIHKLLDVLFKLRDRGNTILIIEHNMDVIKNADYIIDLGPEGGDLGGELVTSGCPEKIVSNQVSYTAKFLKKSLQGKTHQ